MLAIRGGRLYDCTGSAPVEPANVLIEGGRIRAVGPAAAVAIPETASVIDAAGRTVMPGLVDMHVHVVLSGDDALYCWLGAGVTSVRDVGAQPEYLLPLRDEIAAGRRVGPRIFSYGPALNTVPLVSGDQLGPELTALIAREIADAEAGERAVEELIASGVDGIKLYAAVDPRTMQRMIRAVDGRVPVTGHLARTWASEATAAGIDGLEHIYASLYQDVARPEDRHTRDGGNSLSQNPGYWGQLASGWARADLDADHVNALIEGLVERRVALSPTTTLITGGSRSLHEPGLRYLPASLTPERRRRLLWRMPDSEGGEGDSEVRERSRANQLELLGRLHRAGGIIVASTDTPFANMMPGFSLHLELAELVEAGLPNADVLQAATRVAAQVLRRDEELGTLEVGKIANVLILDGDPLVRIDATRDIVAVIKDGVSYEPEKLLGQVRV
ncbi:MAG: amidohydrolase family protein [Myxococcota bacterium]